MFDEHEKYILTQSDLNTSTLFLWTNWSVTLVLDLDGAGRLSDTLNLRTSNPTPGDCIYS